jgi:hypothetical protein
LRAVAVGEAELHPGRHSMSIHRPALRRRPHFR